MSFIPSDQEEIFSELQLKNPEELFRSIPKEVRRAQPVELEPSRDEWQVKKLFRERKENSFSGTSFTGYGHYVHKTPESVDHLSSIRSFVTSYTPYQPELAQGTLQALFEYQSLMSELTSMDIANASLYDGATSLVESIRMAVRVMGKQESPISVLLSRGIHPNTLDVINTYFPAEIQDELNIKIKYLTLSSKTGETDWASSGSDKKNCVVAFQNPNYLGVLEGSLNSLNTEFSESQFLYGTCDPVLLTTLDSPSDCGAGIVWGEGQSLGMPVNYGGPGLGFIAAKNEYLRQMPGRLVGKTTAKDSDENITDAYVITLATREQHIRREKATSNICSNQTLMAMRASIYMASVGWTGMQNAARDSYNNTQYFLTQLNGKGGRPLFPQGKYFFEVPWTVRNGAEFSEACYNEKIDPGVLISNHWGEAGVILSHFNDLHTKEEIDRFINIIIPFLE
ncbi:MAG: aminomethyl-transferring glycine dehydrogenase subunit GcvPA [Leptospirales bacterium]